MRRGCRKRRWCRGGDRKTMAMEDGGKGGGVGEVDDESLVESGGSCLLSDAAREEEEPESA